MARANTSSRLHRLERLTAQLKAEPFCIIKDLAKAHGVSERTLLRDLAVLREQGLPIEADRGRGGGVRLDRRWGVGRLNLDYAEAVDLLIGIEVAQKLETPVFLANLESVKRQLIASFSPDKRERVEALKSRILVGVTSSTLVQASASQSSAPVIKALHQAFIDREGLQVRYQREDLTLSERLIEPHYLLLKYPVWYVLAYDHLREETRTFRCDRILEAHLTDTRFSLRPRADFEHVWEEGALLA
ncbi:helix-turn-helix transcriptional regulator [Oceanicaulis sp. LC35]|uniref:helix-turn-helix transcriptional regulator n=1 Tax=Oceanicaulis sp. LC35 TaxID=3349635 RepID=UPI003F82E884